MGFLKQIVVTFILIISSSSCCCAQGEDDFVYERSSMHLMMVKHLNEKHVDLVESVFLKIPFPERFNEHNLGVRSISFAESSKNQLYNVQTLVREVNIGQ